MGKHLYLLTITELIEEMIAIEAFKRMTSFKL